MNYFIPSFHIHVSPLGYIHVWYFGIDVATVNSRGLIMWLADFVPVYLIDYLLTLPRPEETKWN